MRKHFLALMLLALLPLVGWAQTATLGQVAVGKYTYGDDALPVPVVKDSEGAILTDMTHYTVDANAYDKKTNAVVNKQDMKGGQELYLKITGAGAYIGQEKKAYFTVQKKVLNITVATAFQRNYLGAVEPVIAAVDVAAGAGELEDAAPFNDTYAELGTLSYTYAGYGKPEYNGGEYDITFSGLSSDCYEIKYPAKKFKIVGTNLSGETVTVKAGTAFANKTYKGAAYAPADLTGLKLIWGTKELVQGTDFTIAKGTGDWTTVAGGPHYYNVVFKGNYSGNKNDFASFTIDPAPITVGMEDYSVTYDNADHKTTEYAGLVTFTYMGLVGADVANYDAVTGGFTAPNFVQVGSTAKNAGDYELTINGGNTNTETNYVFNTYLKGKLTIKPIELNIFAKPETKSVGVDDPTFVLLTDAPAGIVAGYKVSGVTFTRAEGEGVGSYDITPVLTAAKVKNGGDDQTKNYVLKAGTPKSQLVIDKGAITVTFKNASKFYGQADPTFNSDSYVVTGLQKGDELPAFEITRENAGKPAGEAAGYYAISATIANPNADKYTSVTVVPGALQIKQAELEITMPTQSVAKGTGVVGDLKKGSITATGINKAGDKIADLLGDLEFYAGVDVVDDATFNPGYKATLKVAAQANYKIVKVNGVAAADPTYATGKLIVGDGTAVAIAFTTAANDADYNLIKAHAGETQDVTVTLNRRNAREVPAGTAHPWKKEIWNTMVLPFEVTVAELSTQLGYAVVNVVNPEKTTEGNVAFKLEMQKIPANTPFCVKTSGDIADAKVLTFANKLIVDGGENPFVDAGQGYKFFGAYKDKTIDKNAPTLYFMRGDIDKWAHIGATSGNSWKVVPFDAYVELTEAAAARGVTFTFEEIDGTVTAINAVEVGVNESSSVKNAQEGWYTLQGVKLDSAPTQKGIYIYNGKKVAVQ